MIFYILAGFFAILSIMLYMFKKEISRYTVGNIWRTEDNSIVIITETRDVKEKYMLKCKIRGQIVNYNTEGKAEHGHNNFSEYIGNKNTHPELIL